MKYLLQARLPAIPPLKPNAPRSKIQSETYRLFRCPDLRAPAKEETQCLLLKRLTMDGGYVGETPSANYAPKVFAKEQEARDAGIKKEDLADAMRRLFKAGKIHNEEYSRSGHRANRLAIT